MKKHHFSKILLVTTEGVETEGAEQTALQLAKRSNANVILADSIRTPFHLPSSPRPSATKIYDVAVKVKQDYLDKVAEPFRSAGIKVETQILKSARSSEDIVKLALSEGCDLVVRYFKGEHSRLPGRFGHTAKNLMRVCPCPLLFVEDKIPDDPKVMACISAEHGIEENQSILNAAAHASRTNAKMHAICCWRFEPAWYLSDDEEMASNEASRDEVQEVLSEIRADLNEKYDLSSFGTRVHVKKGDPIEVIPAYCTEHAIDVVIMSSASLNHPLERLLGSTIEETIERLPCALMVVKPLGFESPVSVEASAASVKSAPLTKM